MPVIAAPIMALRMWMVFLLSSFRGGDPIGRAHRYERRAQASLTLLEKPIRGLEAAGTYT